MTLYDEDNTPGGKNVGNLLVEVVDSSDVDGGGGGVVVVADAVVVVRGGNNVGNFIVVDVDESCGLSDVD